jgi:hypothetical protein
MLTKKQVTAFLFKMLFFSLNIFSQALEDEFILQSHYLPFADGVIREVQELKDGNYRQANIDYQTENAVYLITEDSLTALNPDDYWGFILNHKLYIAFNGSFWKAIQTGTITHFTAVIRYSFVTMDAFGFPVEQESTRLEHFFADLHDGHIYPLTENNLAPYLAGDKILSQRFSKERKLSISQLITYLNAYNQKFPFYLPHTN